MPEQPTRQGSSITDALRRELARVAHEKVLLVATDFDGTLAPIVDEPSDAKGIREGLEALERLARTRRTEVAVVSGRSLDDLTRRLDMPRVFTLVGSHGAEFGGIDRQRATVDAVRHRRDEIVSELERIAESADGLHVESKPHGAAFHYRRAEPGPADAALDRVRQGPAAADDVEVREGKKVVELSLSQTNKGEALRTLRHRLGATAVVFLGDDTTDEDAFAVLVEGDVGVKIGPGETRATHRIASPESVVEVIRILATEREAAIAAEPVDPITSHSILADGQSLALVGPSGDISWWCLPRPDGLPVFGRILDPGGGVFSVRPACEVGTEEASERPSTRHGCVPLSQSYLDDGFRLRTRWHSFFVDDELHLDSSALRSVLSRRINAGPSGCTVCIVLAPSLGLGSVPSTIGESNGGLDIDGAGGRLRLDTSPGLPPIDWAIDTTDPNRPSARATLTLPANAGVVISLTSWFVSHSTPTGTIDAGAAPPVLVRSSPSGGGITLDGRWPESWRAAVQRSAAVLRALCHQESGAILAAATASLPESLGCERNWDYRYCWPRDASLAATALVKLGSSSEAESFLGWLLRILNSLPSPGDLLPIYTIEGFPLPPEVNRFDLRGYDRSTPIRLSNGASHQVQLDVFGPIARLVRTLKGQGRPVTAAHRSVIHAMVDAVAKRWREPDSGIWEVRDEPRHFVHSKAMCWLTVRDAIRVFGDEAPGVWQRLADQIRADVLEHGWSAERNAYSSAYGETTLDAASLWIVLSGLLPPDDARAAATVAAIEQDLRDGPVVYRYHTEDALRGREGGFHICTGWLISAMALTGRARDARVLLDEFLGLAGPTGLYSEMHDPRTGLGLGNHPQAYSHLSVIEAVLAVARAEGLATNAR